MKNDKVKVLNIAGEGRSGSTFLGNVLGQVEGVFFAGEPRGIWDKGVLQNTPCGCGLPFNNCKTWKHILVKAFGDNENMKYMATEMVHMRSNIFRSRHVPLAIISKTLRAFYINKIGCYLDQLDKLYKSVQEKTGCRVIVDSSSYVSHAYLLGLLPSVDLYTLHLVRDVRGVVYSWSKKKKLGDFDDEYMLLRKPLKAAMLWVSANLIGETMKYKDASGKYLRIKYEDFVDRPVEAILSIMNLISEQPTTLPFINDHTVFLDGNHAIWGNPNRFQREVVEIRQDNEWKDKMTSHDKLLVTLMTLPLLFRYGYV